ncbi:MAG: class I SAM-dependent methyltransferase [Candidatus Hodarchaeales archaeon]|jgi:ubiquinone/menaquinone biosynthesis C-methylase UbiE
MNKDFKKRWDRGADTWDLTISSERNPHYHYYRTTDLLVIQLLSSTHAKRALELGCGTAGCAIYAMQSLQDADDLHITGIDISPRMIEFGRRNITQAGLDDRIKLDVGNVDSLSYPDEDFDVVFSRGAVLSYTKNPEQLLNSAHRVLRGDGAIGLDVMAKTTFQRKYYLGKSKTLDNLEKLTQVPNEPLLYTEFSVEENFQVSRDYLIQPNTVAFKEIIKSYQNLPPHLPGIVSDERPQYLKEAELLSEDKNRVFNTDELRELFKLASFRDIKVYGEGYATYLLRDEEMRPFVNKHRDYFSKAEILLQKFLKPDTSPMLFVTGSKRLNKY